MSNLFCLSRKNTVVALKMNSADLTQIFNSEFAWKLRSLNMRSIYFVADILKLWDHAESNGW